MNWLGNDNRAIAIIRVSSAGQKDNTSPQAQERDIREYCERKGLVLTKIAHIVESGFKNERTKYHETIKQAQKSKIRHRIFHRFDREGRNLKDVEDNENLVRAGDAVLHYVQDQKIFYDGSPDTDFFIRDINSVQNKHYSRDLSTKVRRATKAKAESGHYPGTHTPLGYTHCRLKNEDGRDRRRGTVIVRSSEAEVRLIQRLFELRAQSPTPSVDEIRKQALAEGIVPANRIRTFNRASIHRQLTNPFYIGKFTWRDVEYEGAHEHLIADDLFWRVQETFGIKNPYRRNSPGLFGGGWLKCTSCGCNIIYDPASKIIKATGEKKTFHYYHCTNGKKLHPSLKGLRLSEDDLMKQFEPAVREISIQRDFHDEIVRALNEHQVRHRAAIKREIENFKNALESLKLRENRAYDNFDANVIDRETYNQQRIRIQDERSHYTDLMERAQLQINDISNETVKSILELATNAESLWKTRSAQEKRLFLDKLLSNQELDGVTVRYEIVKPLRTLAEMKQNQNWRI